MGGIMTGVATIDMELPDGMDLTGYIGRASGAKGIKSPLKIKCVVFSNQAIGFALVACELLGLGSEFIKETVNLIEEDTSFPAGNIVIACTHTHSGPASIFLQDCGEVNAEWLEGLKKRIVNCMKEALKNLKPSNLIYKTGNCEINMNRIANEKNEAMMSRDCQVGALIIQDTAQGKADTVIVNYACHPVALEYTNLLYSGDYPYYMERAIKEYISGDIDIIFTNGCCGDLNPVKRGGFGMAESLGRELADSVMKIERDVFLKGNLLDVSSITVETIHVDIPMNHKLDEKHIEKLKLDYHNSLNREIADGKDVRIMSFKAYINWAENMLEKVRAGTLPYCINAAIKLIKIGGLVIVALPFEVFHDIGLKIKRHFGYENTMVMGYANGDFGYLISKDQYYKAKYEIEDAYKFYGYPGPFCEDAENIILNEIFHKKGWSLQKN